MPERIRVVDEDEPGAVALDQHRHDERRAHADRVHPGRFVPVRLRAGAEAGRLCLERRRGGGEPLQLQDGAGAPLRPDLPGAAEDPRLSLQQEERPIDAPEQLDAALQGGRDHLRQIDVLVELLRQRDEELGVGASRESCAARSGRILRRHGEAS